MDSPKLETAGGTIHPGFRRNGYQIAGEGVYEEARLRCKDVTHSYHAMDIDEIQRNGSTSKRSPDMVASAAGREKGNRESSNDHIYSFC